MNHSPCREGARCSPTESASAARRGITPARRWRHGKSNRSGGQGAGWTGYPADIEVVAYQPPERYAFRVMAGPVRPTGEYRFAGEGETTTVSLSLDAQMSGLKKLIMSRAVQKSMDGEMQALDRAKAILERG